MSTIVMGACWPLQLPPTAKAVLISLADQANDMGVCWPSIPGICERTCFGRTSVIDALKWLQAEGLLLIDKTGGRNNRYTLVMERVFELGGGYPQPVRQANQSGRWTGPAAGPTSPAGELPPVREADQPVRQADPNLQQPSSKPTRTVKAKPEMAALSDLLSAGFDEQTARDFIAHKAAVKAPLTVRAWMDHLREAKAAGWSPMAAAEKVMARHWKGFESKYVASELPPARQGQATQPDSSHNPDVKRTQQYLASQAQITEEDRQAGMQAAQRLRQVRQSMNQPVTGEQP